MIRKKANVLSVGEEFTLSRAEAERRLKIEGYPSLEQIIQRTKAKADWPDERWDEIRRIAAVAEKPDALVVNRKTVFAHIRHCNRWVAAASSLIFVLAVLLIFIPESRALPIRQLTAPKSDAKKKNFYFFIFAKIVRIRGCQLSYM